MVQALTAPMVQMARPSLLTEKLAKQAVMAALAASAELVAWVAALTPLLAQMEMMAQAAQAAMGVLAVTVPLPMLVLVHLTRTRLAVPAAMAVPAVLAALARVVTLAPMAMAGTVAMAVWHLHLLVTFSCRTRLAVLAVPAERLRGQVMAVLGVMAAMRPLMDMRRTRMAALGVLAE